MFVVGEFLCTVPPLHMCLRQPEPPMTPKQYGWSAPIFSMNIQVPDFRCQNSTELCFCVFVSPLCGTSNFFPRYLFALVQLVYHGSSHSILHMFSSFFTCYLQPLTNCNTPIHT